MHGHGPFVSQNNSQDFSGQMIDVTRHSCDTLFIVSPLIEIFCDHDSTKRAFCQGKVLGIDYKRGGL